MPILRFGGGGVWFFFKKGGSADFIFMGGWIFLKLFSIFAISGPEGPETPACGGSGHNSNLLVSKACIVALLGAHTHTPRGSCSPTGRSKHLLPETLPFQEPLLRTLFSLRPTTICHENITQLIRKKSNRVTVIRNNSTRTGVPTG